MNKLIFRKLSTDILLFFLLSSVVITVIVWVIQAVNLLDVISEDGHGIKIYFLYTILNIPKIFSKLIVFTFFISLFYILNKYEENNEILVFWTNGIKKISFINFIGKLSLFFVIMQLALNTYIVPFSQNLGQSYLKNSSLELFPKLIQEKKFSNVMKNLTIFVEEYKKNGDIKGIYIKEIINKRETKIIVAKSGKIINVDGKYGLNLFNGDITNLNENKLYNINFEETIYDMSKFSSKTRKIKKIAETETLILLQCIEKFFENRKDKKLRCSSENSFLVKDIYAEIFKRIINPIYIIFISLIGSLLVIRPKQNFLNNYSKFILFIFGFALILLCQLSYKYLDHSLYVEIISLLSPILLILLFYLYLLFKTKFRLSYL